MQLIDLCCNFSGYLEEFTEVVKEITKSIFEENELPLSAVNKVIRNWKSFWANQNKHVLSEKELIGLICELVVLKKILEIILHWRLIHGKSLWAKIMILILLTGLLK